MQIEIWKPLENYESLYEISNFGRIRNPERLSKRQDLKIKPIIEAKILKPKTTKCGYKSITLWKNGEPKSHLLHRLIAKEFIENPTDLPQVNHKDGNKENNFVDNLEWVTVSENTIHAFDNKLRSGYSGQSNPMNKYSEDLVARIWLDLLENKLTGAEIADKHNVSRVMVSEIKTGRKWHKFTSQLLRDFINI